MKQSKMQLAQAIYDEVYGEGYDLDGKSPRAAFIERAKDEVGLTANGASTYHQNIRNAKVNGIGLYEYNKYHGKPKSESKPKESKVEETKEDVKTEEVVEDQVQEPQVEETEQVEETKAETEEKSYRWYTVDENGDFVKSFESRAKAQAYAKEIGGKWRDATKD